MFVISNPADFLIPSKMSNRNLTHNINDGEGNGTTTNRHRALLVEERADALYAKTVPVVVVAVVVVVAEVDVRQQKSWMPN